MTRFDDQPVLTGYGLKLRGLRADDFDGLSAAASDPETWAGHPARERYKPEVFRGYFDFLLDSGGTLVVIDDLSDTIIGCSRYYSSVDIAGDVGIGFTFLNRAYWGGKVNYGMKSLMLEHAFKSFDAVWFHIDPQNIRSQKATAKLGVVDAGDATADLGTGAALWKRFRLDKSVWLACEEEGLSVQPVH